MNEKSKDEADKPEAPGAVWCACGDGFFPNKGGASEKKCVNCAWFDNEYQDHCDDYEKYKH